MARRPFQIRGAFDVECADWDRFAVSATHDGTETRIFYDADELLGHLRTQGGLWVAHAGGVYDILLLLERMRVNYIPCQIDRSQHRVTRVVVGDLELRDSYALWPVSLDEICGALRRPIPCLPWACLCKCTCGQVGCGLQVAGSCRLGCGGFCRIAEKAREGDPELENYVAADARAIFDGVRLLRDLTASHGIALRGTLGRTAWISAQDQLGVPRSTMPYEIWRYVRQADKGGRGVVIRPGVTHGPGAHHDICSAYPAQLAHAALPVGECRQLGTHGATQALEEAQPGAYTVSVTVPDDLFLPPLPWAKAGMLTFPTGEFSGTWVLPELVAAFERGVRLRKVHSALVWQATAPVFQELVHRWYQIRRTVGRDTPQGDWMSRLAKALTGTFAEGPDRQQVLMHLDGVKVCARRGPCAGPDGCTKKCGGYEPLDLYGHVWGRPYQRMAESAYPQWSAYLRAMTRIQWLAQAERMGELLRCSACGGELAQGQACSSHPHAAVSREGGGRAICLGNTDSLWHTSRQTPEPLGEDLGQWRYKHAWTELDVRSLSTFSYRDPAKAGPGGAPPPLVVHGVPGLTEEDWARGRGTLDRGVVTFGQAVKTTKGLFHKRSRSWSLPALERLWYGDRKPGSDGLTYPASADQLRELARQSDARRRDRSRRLREAQEASARLTRHRR